MRHLVEWRFFPATVNVAESVDLGVESSERYSLVLQAYGWYKLYNTVAKNEAYSADEAYW